VAFFTTTVAKVCRVGVNFVTSAPRTPLVVAHRGASRAEPPGNTIAAFEQARALGADWVELDVRATADGARAVHHDAHLPDGRALCDVDAADLPDFVPLLAPALDACDGLGVNVEIKNSVDDPDFDPDRAMAEAVVAELDGVPRSRVLVTSFDLATVDRVRSLDHSVPTGLLAYDLEDPEPAIEAAASHGHHAINPWDPYVDDAFMSVARDAGLAVNVWTVNDVDRMQQLIDLGVDAIITDVPDVLRNVLRSFE
jgi:glycerophosphoryl diester phosphodiesterase